MAIQYFVNDAAGIASANAVPDPKHIWVDVKRIVVLTGDDLPAGIDAASLIINRLSLFQGALLRGGQPLLDKFILYAYTTIPTSGTPTQKNVWRECAAFSRGSVYINQLRIAAAITNADMDNVFILGSGYTP